MFSRLLGHSPVNSASTNSRANMVAKGDMVWEDIVAKFRARMANIHFREDVVGAIVLVCSGIWGWRTVICQQYARRPRLLDRGRIQGIHIIPDPERRPIQQSFIYEQLTMSLRSLVHGRCYTFLTSSFAYSEWRHLVANMEAPVSFGPRAVQHYSLAQFLVIWFWLLGM